MVTKMHLCWMSSYSLPASPEAGFREAIQDLEGRANVLASWLVFWTGLVVLGLMMEYGAEFAKWKPKNVTPSRSFIWIWLWGITGGVLVVGGVAGEMYIGVAASRVETKLRENNHQIERILSKEAGDAKTSAEGAASAASRAKTSADGVAQQAANLKQELAEERETRQQLEAELRPRVIDFVQTQGHSNVDPLKPSAGSIVIIEYADGDRETRVAANTLASALNAAGWKVFANIRTNEGMMDGVLIRRYMPASIAEANVNPEDVDKKIRVSLAAASRLKNFLDSYKWDDVRIISGWEDTPLNRSVPHTLNVRVGYKPTKYFRSPEEKEIEKLTHEMVALEEEGKTDAATALLDKIKQLAKKLAETSSQPAK
jgi:hypothetical protein